MGFGADSGGMEEGPQTKVQKQLQNKNSSKLMLSIVGGRVLIHGAHHLLTTSCLSCQIKRASVSKS